MRRHPVVADENTGLARALRQQALWPQGRKNSARTCVPFTNRIRGFTLIEVLIALVVISVGLLGLIALQTRTLHASHNAYLTSLANVQAMDLEERMRSNPSVADTYVTDISPSLRIGNTANCNNTVCSPADLAGFDVLNWQSTDLGLFPDSIKKYWSLIGPDGTADPNKPDGGRYCGNSYYELSLSWDKHDVGGTASGSETGPLFYYCFQLPPSS